MKVVPAWKFWLAVLAVLGGIVFGLYLMSEIAGHPDDFETSLDELIKESKPKH